MMDNAQKVNSLIVLLYHCHKLLGLICRGRIQMGLFVTVQKKSPMYQVIPVGLFIYHLFSDTMSSSEKACRPRATNVRMFDK
jgi:hypothetical protein